MTTPGTLEVVPVRDPDRLGAFIRLPWAIYRDDPNWVSPLLRDMKTAFNPDKHPFYVHSDVEPFLALRDGRPVGRIGAIRNRRHEEFHDEPTGFFGYFECFDDPEAAAALLDAAATWLRHQGLRTMRGPTSFSTNEIAGALVEGFDGPPMVMMAYNPRYYLDLFEACGLVPVKTLLAYMLDEQTPPDYLLRAEKLVRRRTGVTIRTMRKKRFDEELDLIRQIYNSAWEKNWGFVPMTDAEFDFMAKELKPIVDPNLALFAETPEGETIGFALALPNFNRVLMKMNGRLFPFGILKALWHARRIHEMRVITLGLLEKYRGKGIDALFYTDLIRNGAARGITECESSWILEDNDKMWGALEKLGGRRYRSYRLYDRAL